jgi:hypothetical protein
MHKVRARIEQEPDPAHLFARTKWLETISHAVPQSPPDKMQIVAGPMFVRGGLGVLAFVVGTGGLMTADYIASRNDRGYRFQEFEFKSPKPNAKSRQLVRSAVANLAHVRSVFKPSVKDLADLFGVSRQAIYNWQAGQAVSPQNELRLDELAKAADLLLGGGVEDGTRLLGRKLAGGKSMLEAIRDGMAAEDAAKTLLSMLTDEMQQRASLSNRLANRSRKAVDVSTIGSPHLDESA